MPRLLKLTILCLLTVFTGLTCPAAASENTAASCSDSRIDAVISAMPLEYRIGQMLMTDVDGEVFDTELESMLRKYHVGSLILYRHNIKSIEQVIKLTDGIQKAAGGNPVLIAVDQEGGAVARLDFGTYMPGNMALGAARSTTQAYRVGKALGEELKALGINTDLAPVLDIVDNPGSKIPGIRSFGSDPQLVAELGTAYIKGLRDAGVIATAKHFPGHGGAAADSHMDLPSVPYNMKRLTAMELQPFQAAFDKGVDMLMTAHVSYPAIDNTAAYSVKKGVKVFLPATLSYAILTQLARNKMGFRGLILSDSIQMKAIQDNFGSQEEAAVAAVKAGVDVVLVQTGLDRVFNSLLNAVKSGEIPEQRVNETVRRLIAAKLARGIARIGNGKLVPGNESEKSLPEKVKNAARIVGSREHKSIEQAASEMAVTLVRNEDNLLPARLAHGMKIVFFAPSEYGFISIKSGLEHVTAQNGIKSSILTGFMYKNMNSLTDKQKQAVKTADFILLATYSFNADSRNPGKYWGAAFPLKLLDYAKTVKKPAAVMATGDPYDIMYMPSVSAYLAVYVPEKVPTDNGLDIPNVTAGIRAVFGLASPQGRLPVDILDSHGKILFKAGCGISFERSTAAGT